MKIDIRAQCKRRKMCTLRLSSGGITGVRRASISLFWDRMLNKFCGFFPKHLLILVREGSVVSRRDGETIMAEPGDVVLVPKGEAEIEFISSRESHGFRCEVIEFDERSIAKYLRNSHWAEAAAMSAKDCPKVGIKFPALRMGMFPVVLASVTERFAPELVLERIFDDIRHLSAPFSREIFYEPRWKVLLFLESHLWEPVSDTRWRAEYEGGEKTLERDCKFFVGCSVDGFVKLRKIEMAMVWLRSGSSIDAVARALKFESRWEFLCLFSALTRRRAKDIMNPMEETPLDCLSVEEFEEAVSPFWWRRWRRNTVEFPTIQSRLMSQRLQEAERRSRTEDVRLFKRLRNKRDLVEYNEKIQNQPDEASHLIDIQKGPDEFPNRPLSYAPLKVPTPEFKKAAQEFFEMMTTGIEIVVPLFKDAPVRRPIAA